MKPKAANDHRYFLRRARAVYHLLYGDWDASIRVQGAALAKLLDSLGVQKGSQVLDAACGIGTQTIGLATRGYRLQASDVSAGEVARLKGEAANRNVHIEARIDDLRTLSQCADDSVDAVIACDNSIPHLLTDAELLQAFRSCLRVLRPNGVAVYSVRDYADIERKNPDVKPYGLRTDDQGRFLAVQVWEWAGDQYDLRMYLTRESPSGNCETQVLVSRYYAVTIDRLLALMSEAGFVSVQRLDGVLFQPVLSGRKPAC